MICRGYHRSDIVSFSCYHKRGYTMSVFAIDDGVNLHHLVKVVPAEFLCCRVTIFLLIIKYI